MFSSESWLSNQQAGFYNNVATQSLRLDSGSSNHLYWTPSTSSTSTRTFTVSTWVKLGNLKTGSDSLIWCGQNVSGTTNCDLNFKTSSGQYYFQIGANGQSVKNTSQLSRDVSAWYHLVAVFDTTQGTDTNRIKLYVNGEQITISGTFPSQNTDFDIGGSNKQMIGALNLGSAGRFFDGYIGEFNFVDGQALTPTSFGETKNGVWIAKKYTGSYGTNGFRLQFNQTGTGTASTSTIGADTSGNTNHFTSSGIVASDCDMPDSPELNWCTLNSVAKSANVTLSEGNLGFSCSATNKASSSTFGVSSGKWYWEIRSTSSTGGSSIVGIVDNTFTNENFFGSNSDGYGYSATALKYNNGSGSSYGATWTNGDIIGVALDLDAGTLTFYKNNSSQGTAYSSISGTFSPILSGQSGTTYVVNFGQDSTFLGAISAGGNADGNGIGDFAYAPPSGFLALCTSNLPEPTISPNADTQADDYFNTVIYSGNGGTQSITDVGFQSDWVWLKNRNGTGIHGLFDSSRGVTKYLSSNSTNAEATASGVTSFDSNGFSLGSAFNQSSLTFVAWNWLANGGTTSSNTDGSITSTVQANTDAGFSIVSYTGNNNATTNTIGHGLSKAPEIVFLKRRNTGGYHWMVGYNIDGNAHSLYLDDAAAQDNELNRSPQAFTATTFRPCTVAPNLHSNGIEPYIAYAFHSVDGYSKIGSYTGNGSADGTFVYTGFRPAFIMWKRTDSSTGGEWVIQDTTRREFNPMNVSLYPNLSNAEATGETFRVQDTLSNGFKLRASASQCNASGGTYIYMAFAEAPFKYANAR
jgi:hypothetical protein